MKDAQNLSEKDLSVAKKSKMTKKNGLLLDLLIIMFVVMLAFGTSVALREYVILSTNVEGTSMESTLFTKDKVYMLRTNKVGRGDIIRLENPCPLEYNADGSPKDKYLIKRVIGIAGDTVEIRGDGYVYLNGEKLIEAYTKTQGSTFSFEWLGDTNIKIGTIYEPIIYIVPENEVFVLGDNREVSLDGRRFGTVSLDKVYGKTLFVIRGSKIIFLKK
ncbi:MAG: signal peptidase I [Clostridiales bacterium]|jgi:signal peptidase I|nr:signal peptidase I [Clostridiales bacterium]